MSIQFRQSRFGKVPLVLSLAAALAAPVAVAAAAPASADPGVPQLVDVRAASHANYDRVVWEFEGGLPENQVVTKVATLNADGSGEPIRIAGSTILQVTMFMANAHETEEPFTATAPRRLVPGMTNVAEIRQSGDFEATVTYGVGLVKNQPYKITRLTNPSRIVLDVRTDYAKAFRSVRFLDVANYASGTSPYTKAVTRKVPAGAPAGAVLHHLFAGPTAAEKAAGLATRRSGATGFKNLSISSGGVARVTLTGGCNSGGSTFTVYNLIRRTLLQFDNVDFVKVYDPSGNTGSPTGRSDSMPECLEP